MNILHISTTDSGGPGLGVIRLHKELLRQGYLSKVLVLHKTTNENEVYKYSKAIQNPKIALEILSDQKEFVSTDKTVELFTDDRSPYDISSHDLVKNADVICLRWVAGFINIQEFFSNIKKPIIWRLSDVNPFTGGCHALAKCSKYQNTCTNCPQLPKKSRDYAREIWMRKKEAYLKNNTLRIVCPSTWLYDLASKSTLLKNFDKTIIPTGICTETFKPVNQELARETFGISKNEIVLLFGAMNPMHERKGFSILKDALERLSKNLLSTLSLLIVGQVPKNQSLSDIPIKIIRAGKITNEEERIRIFNCADIYVMPSLEEAFGQMCLEAMSCGTPVIASNTGGMADMIDNNQNGILFETGNSLELARSIEKLSSDNEYMKNLGISAREKVLEKYTQEIQAKKYVQICKELLEY